MVKKEDILSYIKTKDEIAFNILEKYNVPLRDKEYKVEEYFHRLCTDIVGQQLSNKAAASIIDKFEKYLKEYPITPELILKTPDQELRDVGMAWSKVRAIKDLANKTINKEITFSKFPSFSNEEIQNQLIQVKGIGTWTSEMFLMFTLNREDVFSNKDLGLKKGICNFYYLDIKSKDIENKVLEISEKWKPYRTYMALALWRSIDRK